MSRKGDEDFITSELFGLWEGLGSTWVEEQHRKLVQAWDRPTGTGGKMDLLGQLDVDRVLAKLRGEQFDEPV